MSDLTVEILMVIGMLVLIGITVYDENKIKNLEKENAVLKKELELRK